MAIVTEDFSGKTAGANALVTDEWEHQSIAGSNTVLATFEELAGSYSGQVLAIRLRGDNELDTRQQGKIRWMEGPSPANGDNWSVLALVRTPTTEDGDLGAGGRGPGIGAGMTRDGFDSCSGAMVDRALTSSQLEGIHQVEAGATAGDINSLARVDTPIGLGERWFVRAARADDFGNFLGKAWKAGDDEPEDWQFDRSAGTVIAGPLGIIYNLHADLDAEDDDRVMYVEYLAGTTDLTSDGHPEVIDPGDGTAGGGGGEGGHPRPLTDAFLKALGSVTSLTNQWT